jgi:hypothetical protein
MGIWRDTVGLAALACMLLNVLPCAHAVCHAKDVDVWYAGPAGETIGYINSFEAAGYRLLYSGHYLTDTDLRVNAISIKDSTIKSNYALNVLPANLVQKTGFCINTISAHTNGKDYITAEYEECDSSYKQTIWTGMSSKGFQDKAEELHLGPNTLRTFAAYGCE